MTVCVGMDVHRKRSQVTFVDAGGALQRDRNLAEPRDPEDHQCPADRGNFIESHLGSTTRIS